MSVVGAEKFILRYQGVAVGKGFKWINIFFQLKNKICSVVNAVIRNIIKNML